VEGGAAEHADEARLEIVTRVPIEYVVANVRRDVVYPGATDDVDAGACMNQVSFDAEFRGYSHSQVKAYRVSPTGD